MGHQENDIPGRENGTLMQCEHFEQILSKGLAVFNKISMKI